ADRVLEGPPPRPTLKDDPQAGVDACHPFHEVPSASVLREGKLRAWRSGEHPPHAAARRDEGSDVEAGERDADHTVARPLVRLAPRARAGAEIEDHAAADRLERITRSCGTTVAGGTTGARGRTRPGGPTRAQGNTGSSGT